MKVKIRDFTVLFIVINIIIYSGLTLNFFKNRSLVGSEKLTKEPKQTVRAINNQDVSITDPPRENHFPYGQCTWYVATRRNIPWNGNAIDWYYNARIFGRKVGKLPRKGAIMVSRESSVGHVAYVENVIGDNFKVTEMNNPYWGKVTERNLTVKEISLVGFIY